MAADAIGVSVMAVAVQLVAVAHLAAVMRHTAVMRQVAVIPAFNEEATVGMVVHSCRQRDLEACVVDDGSSDRTADVARSAGASVVRLPINVGVGGALRAGFAWAVERGYDRVIQLDGDGQHDPASIDDLLAAADASGAELVVGSRFSSGDYVASRGRRAMMRLLGRIVSRRVGVAMDDVTSGYRVISQPLLGRFAADYPTEFLSDTIEAILAAHSYGAKIAQAPAGMLLRSQGTATSRLAALGHLMRVLFAIAVKRPS